MTERMIGQDLAEKKKKLIMVVDGNPKDSLTTGMVLQNFGYSVTMVRSAEEALEFLSIAVPALVVIEFILPGMNGIDLIGRMGRDPSLSRVPAIVQTGHPDPSTAERCLAAGCVHVLRKPVSGEDLYRAVQSVVERTPRKNVRVATFLKASVDGSGTGAEFVTQLSEQGVFIKTLHARSSGSRRSVSFMLKKRIVRVEAQVLYAYGFGDGPGKDPGMGMKFLSIGPEGLSLIREHIKESFSAGTPVDSLR
ncbi:MAG: response regulator [Nitrospirota bacterium]